MRTEDYLQQLASLDFEISNKVDTFLHRTQAQHIPNLPQSIPLGIHEDTAYYLKSTGVFMPLDYSSLPLDPNPTDYDPGLFAISATHAITQVPFPLVDLEYGLLLGRLFFKSTSAPEHTELEDAGFYIITNAVDKSIWCAFDFDPYAAETGDIRIIHSEAGEPYG